MTEHAANEAGSPDSTPVQPEFVATVLGEGTEPHGAAPAQADFGSALRTAREAAGISVSTLAGRLRLHVKQIEALERNDLASLPTLIYVRGFIRSCARELRIAPEPLLADLDRRAGVVPGSIAPPVAGSFQLSRFGDGSRPIILLSLAACSVIEAPMVHRVGLRRIRKTGLQLL